jgi:hypothetical protein
MKIENKDLSLVTFALFIMFLVFFIMNRYTMNVIMMFIMLIFSMSFKTWQLIKEVKK